jgi:adenylate kinase family enzyme
MNKRFFIFIGRSGCGKGTQAELLKEKLDSVGHTTVHVTTGGGFREFTESGSYIANLSKEINEEGGLQPEFLAVWNWSNIFINLLKGGESIILDGAPRKPFEVHVLHSLISFLGYEKPTVIYLNVTEGWARERLLGRKRQDDTEETIMRRLSWFDTEVIPSLEVYLHDPRYTVLRIHGERPIETIHEDIWNQVNEKVLS